jgi:2-polyprenyl-6-methoxyphenol hydroxylase-like FAD-dependent oxidoreductase
VGDDTIYDVAIVGYGPVGTALAILLAQRGRRVVVLERQPQPYPLPRAAHFDHEAARILQACGIGDGLASLSEPADVYEWRNGEGATLLRIGGTGTGSSGWPESSMFCQPQLEALLDERARSLPGVEVRRGVDVVGLDDDGTVATLHVGPVRVGQPGPHPAGDTVRARFAVGCDGANSTVRGLVVAPVHDLGFFYDWLIVDVVLADDRVFDPINLQICDPTRPTTAVSGGPGRRRWEFMRLPHETLDELDDEATAWRLLAPWDITAANATLERHAVYTFQARWAERWRTGHVLLAGDSAHQMPPFAGQGLCAGLRDAANLAWKLDLVLGGHATVSLLDTYGTERMPHVRAVTDLSVELGEIICIPDPEQAAARDETMTAGVDPDRPTEPPPLPGIGQGVCLAGSPHAGQLFVQGAIAVGGRRTRFDDHLGAGWRLVTQPHLAGSLDELDAELAAWFACIGGRVVAVGDGGDVGDPDRTYDAWFTDHAVSAALQRPDFYLYGTANDPAGAVRLLSHLRADLDAPTFAPSCP